jgi:hypothetical protein
MPPLERKERRWLVAVLSVEIVDQLRNVELRLHHQCHLTFDVSGGWRQAKPAVGRPLDGGVRLHVVLAGQGRHVLASK